MSDIDEYKEIEKQKYELAKQLVKKEEKVQPEASLEQKRDIKEQKRDIKGPQVHKVPKKRIKHNIQKLNKQEDK